MTRHSYCTLAERQAAPSRFHQVGLRLAIDRELFCTLHRIALRPVRRFSHWKLPLRAASPFLPAWSALGIRQAPYQYQSASSLLPQVHTLARLIPRSSLVLHRFASRPANSKLPQLFLQTLPVQTNCRRSARNIPAMACQLLCNPSDFEFALRFAEVALVHSGIHVAIRI